MEEEEEQGNNSNTDHHHHPLLQKEKIIVEIVSRLPFDSILQCRRVCKSWCALLRGSIFNQIHTHHHVSILLQQQQLDDSSSCSFPMNLFRLIGTTKGVQSMVVELEDYYYYDDGGDHERLQVRIPRDYSIINKELLTWDYIGTWSIMGSCNGLICLFDCDDEYFIVPVIIYNPITREYVNLPNGGDESKRRVSDVGTCCAGGGFGYISLTNEYKVVRIIHHRPTDDYSTTDKIYIRCVRIYTLGSGEWRSKEEEELVDYSFSSKGVLLNGSLYWLSIDGGKILAFNLKDEKFRISPSPPPPCLLTRDDLTSRAACDVGVLGKLLCITEHKGFKTDIWVKNTYTKKDSNNNPRERYWWSIAYSITLRASLVLKSSNLSLCEPIALTKRGKILCLYNRMHVVCFDPRTNRCVPFEDDDHKGDGWLGKDYSNPQSISYTKSFVSLKALGEDDAKIVERVEVQRYGVNVMYGHHDLQYPYNSFGNTGGRIVPYSSIRTPVHQEYDEETTTEKRKLVQQEDNEETTKTEYRGDTKRKLSKLCTSFLLHLLVDSS